MATTIEQQVALDEALVPSTKRCPFFKAFLVTADVQKIYMQEFWATTYVHQHSIRFKLDNKKHIINLETFRDMLHICPRIPGQSFDELPFEDEILEFLWFLEHSAQIRTLTDVNINKLFQPWRSFGAIINKCLTGKSSSFDSFRLSQAQILWGLYHSRNIDYAFLIWEDFVYQIEHKNHKKSNEMYYPRFTKVIIHHFMSKDLSIPRRNKVNWHYIRDDIIFSTIKVAYKEYYACATGEASPKPKDSARRNKSGSNTSITPPTTITTPTTTVVVTPRLTAAAKGKQPAKAVHLTPQNEGSGSKPGVPDAPSDDLEEEISWNSSDDEDVDAQKMNRDGDEGDEKDESDNGEEDDDDERGDDDDDDEETKSDEESDGDETREDESFDPIPRTPEDSEDDGNGEEEQGLRIREEERIHEEEEADELYRDALMEAYETDKIILDTYGERVILKRRRDDDDDQGEGPSAGLDRGSTTGSKSQQALTSESAFVEEPVQTTSQIEEPSRPVFEIGAEDQPVVQSSQHTEWFSQPKKPPTSDRDWNKTLPAAQGSTQTWISELAKQAVSRSSFNELLDTPLDFSNFIMNRLRVDTLTPELLARPTYELMKRSCNSLIELENHLEKVYKVITDQLDWVNPEGQQYLHNLLQPLPLISDNRGRRVIPFVHFINNDLEYLRGGASSRKYTTFVTKTKAANYGHIKWIEDLVPRTMWIQKPINYDKHALWGVSYWGRIIAITDLKIVEWHNYKHLDWISVRCDDDKIYKFKEGDFKRLHLQDIEDMLLLLVQGKLSNLTVEERFAFNVSLRMFTRSIVIQRRVKDLQLGVESYQKRLNLTKPDTYRSDLKQREAYTAYSNPRGFIYQNKDKKNRLMRIDELYKFSDGTLNDVCNALDDRLKGIRMQYLPQTIWRKGDKDRATAMIQAIDKMLKTRRIMRSLERFVDGRLFEGDFWMLQRTI
nr:hypothetical protein [Tanacetum cinerariifolium]